MLDSDLLKLVDNPLLMVINFYPWATALDCFLKISTNKSIRISWNNILIYPSHLDFILVTGDSAGLCIVSE